MFAKLIKSQIRARLQSQWGMLEKFLLVVAILCALIFSCTVNLINFFGDELIKALPIVYLAILVIKYVKGWRGLTMGAGLLLGASGDVALELNPVEYFELGLVLFLGNHLFYIITFFPDLKLNKLLIIPAVMLALFGATVIVLIFPQLNSLLIPVIIYFSVIMLMNYLALFHARLSPLLFWGAILFLLSDSLLALNRFLPEDPLSSWLIMPTYYLAQFIIAGSFLFFLPDKQISD